MDPTQQPPQPPNQPQPAIPSPPVPVVPAPAQPNIPPAPSSPTAPAPVQYQPHMAAFMYEQPSNGQTAQAKKSHKKLILIIVLFIIIAAGGAAGYILTRKKPVPAPSPTPANVVVDEPVKTPTTNDGVIKLTDTTKVTEAPSFNIPTAATGWKPDVVNGVPSTSVIVHTGGCKLYYTAATTQKTDSSTDEKGTDDVIASDLKRLQESNTVTDVVDGVQELSVKDSTNKLEFKTTDYTVSTELAEQKVIMSVRQIDGYVLGLRFYCSPSAFSADLNTQILDLITVNLKLKDGQ